MRLRRYVVAVGAMWAVGSAAARQGGGAGSREWFFEDQGRFYAAKLTAPAESNGVSVLLIGGGSASDVHWTVPASYTVDGKTTECTIDGKETRDADTIAGELAATGFVVMQWSAVHRDDEQAKVNPAMAMGLPFPRSVELATRAYRELLAQPEAGGEKARVILVGHSLGATRACLIADGKTIGVVSLAGAYLSKLAGTPSKLVADMREATPGLDADANGTVSPGEFDALAQKAGFRWAFSLADRDKDGSLAWWEVTAAQTLDELGRGGSKRLSGKPTFRDDLRWPVDILKESKVPVLAVCGGLDPISIHGPLLEYGLAGRDGVTVEYFAGLGHQLGQEVDGKTGPIDERVVKRVADWCAGLAK